MREGQITKDARTDESKVWYSFNLQQLEWLQTQINPSDEFYHTIMHDVEKLERIAIEEGR